jgi:O-succinylbenzoic acid--CoA ligase
MTETISHIAIKKINGLCPDENYKTLNGVSVSSDADGCLIIDAPGINIHSLITNDLVKIISPTEFSWLGRTDNVINTGGIKINPEAIEQKLLQAMGIPFFVTGIADDRTGQKPVLVLELGTLSEYEMGKLKTQISNLGKYERLRAVYLIPEFARTDTGKINRKATIGKLAHVIAL